MRFTFLATVVGLAVGAFAQSSVADAYVASESSIAKAGVLANIGPSGSKSQGAKASDSSHVSLFVKVLTSKSV